MTGRTGPLFLIPCRTTSLHQYVYVTILESPQESEKVGPLYPFRETSVLIDSSLNFPPLQTLQTSPIPTLNPSHSGRHCVHRGRSGRKEGTVRSDTHTTRNRRNRSERPGATGVRRKADTTSTYRAGITTSGAHDTCRRGHPLGRRGW